MVGVLSFGRGLFDREPIENGKTSYRVFYRLKPDHVVMSQLFGWEGALALSNDKFAGKFLSPQFPTFLCDHTKLDRQFLGWLMRRPAFWEDLGTRASGMGDRRRTLNPDALFRCEIPLPPLAQQRELVAQVEALANHLVEANSLRQEALATGQALVVSTHTQLSRDRSRKLRDILTLHEDASPISPTGSYPQVGVKSFGAGLFPKAAVAGTATTYRTFNRLYDGALVLSQVKGWEGAVAICPPELAGWFVSPEYRTFRCVPVEARPSYLAPLVRTEWFWSKLSNATRGAGARRERTRPEQFLQIELPMPDVERQKRGEAIFAQLEAATRLQAETIPEMHALLPAILDRAFRGEL
jgi:type I restriction enzyme S subunit